MTRERSRIVLVGAPVDDDQLLPDLPEVTFSVADLAGVFTDPKLGGFRPQHCIIAEPGATVDRIGDLLDAAAEQAEDLLLVYFVGHGLVGPRRELYLCLKGSRFRNPSYWASASKLRHRLRCRTLSTPDANASQGRSMAKLTQSNACTEPASRAVLGALK